MKLLVLGGTVFLGRHVVEIALAQGHEVTMFNRGQHSPELFPEAKKLRGDRDGGLSALESDKWDAVIDTCGYVPRLVGDSASLLADRVDHYVYVSSISAYADYSKFGIVETDSVGTLKDESTEEVDGETYGPLKALCEQAAESAMPGRVCNVRAGLIVGPHDQSDRFTYWPARVDRGGEVLAPGSPDFQVQIIDVRDLAAWMIKAAEIKVTGVFNVTGPDYSLNFGEMLEACQEVSASDAKLTWVDATFLAEKEVGFWIEMPLWLDEASAGMTAVSLKKVLETGITYRPLEESIRDTLAWHKTRPADLEMKAGIDPEKERKVLSDWAESR
jgi:2'-hydroxyisoflavone reductase